MCTTVFLLKLNKLTISYHIIIIVYPFQIQIARVRMTVAAMPEYEKKLRSRSHDSY